MTGHSEFTLLQYVERSIYIKGKIIIPRKKLTAMPNTFSKPVSHKTSPMRHTYVEPISFIAQTDNKNSVKPTKEKKVKLCQDPTDPNSDEVSKTFTEFVGTTPEAYCQWMCDMEENIRGKGIVTPAATITASQQLLSQPHCMTLDNCVVGIVPNGPVTTVQEVQQIYDTFALTFMDNTAWGKQKCYMVSGSIQKPKSHGHCNKLQPDFESLFTLFAWYSSVIHGRRDERHACGYA
jgi:hypothetical protein